MNKLIANDSYYLTL